MRVDLLVSLRHFGFWLGRGVSGSGDDGSKS